MRVVLKHASAGTLTRWMAHEARTLRRAPWPHRVLKLRAMVWNARHLPSVLSSRRRLRRAPGVPDRLIDPCWGDGFPAGVPPRMTPRPENAGSSIDMANTASEGQLLYGWFPAEHVDGRSYRWAGERAAALMTLKTPAKRLRLDYAHVPVDIGGVDVHIRRLGSSDPLTPVWSTRLLWQYIARSIENHPLALAAGDYEVVFSVSQGWTDPPNETRSLGFALASMSVHESYEIASGGLDMAAPAVEEQLICGWFEAEQSAGRSYRWASRARGGDRAPRGGCEQRLPELPLCARPDRRRERLRATGGLRRGRVVGPLRVARGGVARGDACRCVWRPATMR